MELTPLVRSAEFDDVEKEFKALFLSLYKQHIDEQVTEVGLYGMPHIGPDSLVERSLVGDGLAVLRTTTMEQIRHLFHAWRYRNPQRGTKFLAAYLKTLFGPVFTIDQLWCKKAGEYPLDVMTESEMRAAGENEADYFLTSRLRVDIETQIIPARILKAARTAVAARFVLELRAAQRTRLAIPIGYIGRGVSVGRSKGNAQFVPPIIHGRMAVGVALLSGGTNLFYSRRQRVKPPERFPKHTYVVMGDTSVVFNGIPVVMDGGFTLLGRVVVSRGKYVLSHGANVVRNRV